MRDLIKYLELERDSATGKARVMFQDWINQLEARHPVRDYKQAYQKSDSRSKTGVAGISTYQAKPHFSRYYRVAYYKEGRSNQKYFNRDNHGDQQAWNLACKFRLETTGILIVYVEKDLPFPIVCEYELA